MTNVYQLLYSRNSTERVKSNLSFVILNAFPAILELIIKFQVRRLQFAGHCYRSKNEVVIRVILWEPRHGRRSKGRPAKSYINILAADTGDERSELPGLMGNRERWKIIVDSARARSTE